jgi:hypothetical protein
MLETKPPPRVESAGLNIDLISVPIRNNDLELGDRRDLAGFDVDAASFIIVTIQILTGFGIALNDLTQDGVINHIGGTFLLSQREQIAHPVHATLGVDKHEPDENSLDCQENEALYELHARKVAEAHHKARNPSDGTTVTDRAQKRKALLAVDAPCGFFSQLVGHYFVPLRVNVKKKGGGQYIPAAATTPRKSSGLISD